MGSGFDFLPPRVPERGLGRKRRGRRLAIAILYLVFVGSALATAANILWLAAGGGM